ncbi:F0F1 ATP synthase subunit B [Limibacter armeniacum]|uniref:F0F1 ATP synthase subunit B n=1 Tax=Limibacter armeniacum TaxID=466084 RepID=UPI002FE5D15B
MSIITPGIGLIFWTTLFFLIVVFILGKKVFPEIAKALREREDSIDKALNEAETARKDVAGLKADIDKMKQEARAERQEIIKEAEGQAKKIVVDAQEAAKSEGDRIIKEARESIEAEKRAAMAEVKDQVATLSLEIAEKVIRQKLEADEAQKQLVKELLAK